MPWYWSPNHQRSTVVLHSWQQQSGCWASLGLLHTETLSDVGRTVKVDSLENNKCFPLSTAQGFLCWHHWNWCWPWHEWPMFGYSSLTMNIDPVELLTNSFGGNRKVEVHIYFCSGFYVFWIQFGLVSRRLPLASPVTPVGCGSSYLVPVICRHYPG